MRSGCQNRLWAVCLGSGKGGRRNRGRSHIAFPLSALIRRSQAFWHLRQAPDDQRTSRRGRHFLIATFRRFLEYGSGGRFEEKPWNLPSKTSCRNQPLVTSKFHLARVDISQRCVFQSDADESLRLSKGEACASCERCAYVLPGARC